MSYDEVIKAISSGFAQFTWLDALDIIIIFLLLYKLIVWTKETRAYEVLKGIGLLFLRGSSSGGTELLSMLLLRVFPNMPVGSLLMCIDAAVVALAVLVFRDLEVALYSMVTIFVCSKVIDGIMEGMNYAKVIYVVTDRGDAVTEALNTGTERGVTVLPAQGGYTRRHKDVLMTVTRQNAMAQTLRLIKQTDPRAFLFVVNATEVHGEGFQKYDAAIK